MTEESHPFAAAGDPTEILNWRRFNARLTTSGQPTESELGRIRDLGVARIINLGLASHKNALLDERTSVEGLGMVYIHIPVDFTAPSEDDFTRFNAALADSEGAPVHVHCIYNARVTAFLYRHTQGTGASPRAADMLESIWRPGGVWARFIGRADDAALPDRYAGTDY